jgi:hypothetical protein
MEGIVIMTLNEVCNPIINKWMTCAAEQPTKEEFATLATELEIALDTTGFRLIPSICYVDEVGLVVDFIAK